MVSFHYNFKVLFNTIIKPLRRTIKMEHVFCVANQKGGVGKSTTCGCLASALSEHDLKILIVDLDPQAGLTTSLGFDPDKFEKTIYDVLSKPDEVSLNAVTIETEISVVYFIPSNLDLAGAEAELIGEIGWDRTLRDALGEVASKYDYIILDCPPSLGVLTTNALMASKTVIVPLQCEYLPMRGLKQLYKIIDKVKRRGNPKLDSRILRTMHDRRTLHSTEVLEEIAKVFPHQVFQSVINRTIKFADSTVAGKPILLFAGNSEGAEAYRNLVKEILNHD